MRAALRPFVVAPLLALLLAPAGAIAQGDGASLPGFVNVPEGKVVPGCRMENIKARAGNPQVFELLQYERWGDLEHVTLREFWIGKYEVTNAQWKHYLDDQFRREHATSGQESLETISAKYVSHLGEPDPGEWKAIFAFNADAIRDAIEKAGEPRWEVFEKDISRLAKHLLPKGVVLTLYAHRTPRHWYAWHPLVSGLLVGKEYCDIRKPPEEAFRVPDGSPFTRLRETRELREADFARCPIRDISPREALAFADWAGCQLPTEYEWVRAGKGDWPIEDVYTFRGKWDREKQKTIFAWADNPACAKGPLAVDDPSVQASDSQFGCRHLLGNVQELTRTFYDYHPELTGKPPAPPEGLFNYSLVVKGGSWGQGHFLMQLTARAGIVGVRGVTSLDRDNRADTLGLRLVRHPRACHDLLLHSIYRMTYGWDSAIWGRYYPHAFALPHLAGLDTAKFEEGGPAHVHVKRRARGIGVVPLWFTELDASLANKLEKAQASGKPEQEIAVFGILRSDFPFVAGVRLTPDERAALEKHRKEYAEYQKKLKEKPKKGEAKPEPVPPPPEPDRYEKATERLAGAIGLWREKTVPAGEWFVVCWNGFLALANKTLVMPPDAILFLEKNDLVRENGPAKPASATADPAKGTVVFTLSADEQNDPRKPSLPPGLQNSDVWALCETLDPAWTGWPGRKPGRNSWRLTFTLRFEPGALEAHDWNR
jgi:formylglycine-generating enzyme required for sulfatase activity